MSVQVRVSHRGQETRAHSGQCGGETSVSFQSPPSAPATPEVVATPLFLRFLHASLVVKGHDQRLLENVLHVGVWGGNLTGCLFLDKS